MGQQRRKNLLGQMVKTSQVTGASGNWQIDQVHVATLSTTESRRFHSSHSAYAAVTQGVGE
jgi:hypothetical protein